MMTNQEKRARCKQFFKQLREALGEDFEHTRVGRVNDDHYLSPKGTKSDISYYSKPAMSFRYSYHWNWYAGFNKCNDPDYVQCESVDMPVQRKRDEATHRSEPRYGYQIAFYGLDNKYHCVYGEKFNRKTRSWEWVEGDVDDVVDMVYGFMYYSNAKEA